MLDKIAKAQVLVVLHLIHIARRKHDLRSDISVELEHLAIALWKDISESAAVPDFGCLRRSYPCSRGAHILCAICNVPFLTLSKPFVATYEWDTSVGSLSTEDHGKTIGQTDDG